MQLVRSPFLLPPPHHHHWHYFDITKLPYQKQYPRHLLQKPPKVKVSLLSWFQDLWWSSTIFRLNMTESWILFVNWQGVYDECPSYDGFSSYDVCLAYQMVNGQWWVSIIWCEFIIWWAFIINSPPIDKKTGFCHIHSKNGGTAS